MHFEFTRTNIEAIILRKKVEDLMNVRGIGEKRFLKIKPLISRYAQPGWSVRDPLREPRPRPML